MYVPDPDYAGAETAQSPQEKFCERDFVGTTAGVVSPENLEFPPIREKTPIDPHLSHVVLELLLVTADKLGIRSSCLDEDDRRVFTLER